MKCNQSYMETVFRCFIASQYPRQYDACFVVTQSLRVLPRQVGHSVMDRGRHAEIYSYRQYSEEKTRQLRDVLISMAMERIQVLKGDQVWTDSRLSLMALCITVLRDTIKVDIFYKDREEIVKKLFGRVDKFEKRLIEVRSYQTASYQSRTSHLLPGSTTRQHHPETGATKAD